MARVPIKRVQTYYGEFIGEDFSGEISPSFKSMHFILRDHISPQGSIRSSLIIRTRCENIMSVLREGRDRGLRPDIIVAIRGDDWDGEWIKWIFGFKDLVEFIPDEAV